MKYFYHGKFEPEKLPKLNIDRQTVFLVPDNSTVLEIGCADGFMGEYLIKKKGCLVVGVEKDSEAAKRAEKRGLKMIV
ncbi:MAG: methionine biosynthesis protein MetW, partial [Microgenomates group bacterium]